LGEDGSWMHCAFWCARTTNTWLNHTHIYALLILSSFGITAEACIYLLDWYRSFLLCTIISRNTMAATPFDPQRAYAPQEDVFFDDGREIELLHFVYSRPNLSEIRGSPQQVLAAIDEYGRTKKYLMNVGEDKGKIVTDLIAEVKPKVMVELGGYVGYSAILFADAVRKAGGQHYYCLERNPEFAAVVTSLVDLAGLSDLVKVFVGASGDSLRRLNAEGKLPHIDLLFLDHYKPAYVVDLKLCEQLKMVGPGSVLAADNVIKPGNPPYLKYVRSSVEEKRQAGDEAIDMGSFFPETTAKQYLKREGKEQYLKKEGEQQLDLNLVGDPNLVYKSGIVHSYEPTGVPDGVEISRCVGRET
ncbi:unnamed protein product, partial [Clonostachys byssicola]